MQSSQRIVSLHGTAEILRVLRADAAQGGVNFEEATAAAAAAAEADAVDELTGVPEVRYDCCCTQRALASHSAAVAYSPPKASRTTR